MGLINILTDPVVLLFGIITIGILIGKIKVFGISFDISAVLITAILVGWIFTKIEFLELNDALNYDMNLISKVGTAIFVSAIGIPTGYSLAESCGKNNIIFLMLGVLATSAGITAMKCIEFLDREIEGAELLGVLCGALTSTPGLAVLCEKQQLNTELVMLGYGSSYIIGVISIVLFVQLVAKKKKYDRCADKTGVKNREKFDARSLSLLGASVVLGNIIGNIKIPYINISPGSSVGILCSAILIGFVFSRLSKSNAVPEFFGYRTLGLAMFFVGKGLPAGMQLKNGIEIKWILYGAIISAVSILTVYLLSEYVFKKKEASLSVVSGGMTSTPAIAVLLKNLNVNVSLQAYSMAYIGALLAMILAMKVV